MILTIILSACGGSGGNTDQTVMAPVVNTRSGLASGIMDNGAYAYLGIPFAAPPVGDRRWRLPEKEPSWSGVFNADHLSPACPQDLPEDNLYELTEWDEDCLYLNVWTPEDRGAGPWPVMFWIHGGAFVGGSASQSLYNGAKLSQKGVVVVTANYRLGPLGYMVHQELYDQNGQTGNYGLFDQIAALEWVRENIAAFGGDPDNVTIFGESAGGCSVNYLQNAPQAWGLFNRAIAQSGTGGALYYVMGVSGSWQEAAASGQLLQTALGAADVEAMRRISAGDIIRVAEENQLSFGPVMDGIILKDDPRRTSSGPAGTPMIIGTVRDEGSLFIYEFGLGTVNDYEQYLTAWFGDNAAEVLALYPAADDEEAFGQAGTVLAMSAFQETTRHFARGASKYVPVYRYLFQYVPPTDAGRYLGSFHGSELAYVFGNLNPEEGYGRADVLLSNQIMELWTSFAKTGVPASETTPEWPAYAAGEEAVLNIIGPGDYNLVYGPANQECDFFESMAPTVDPDYPINP